MFRKKAQVLRHQKFQIGQKINPSLAQRIGVFFTLLFYFYFFHHFKFYFPSTIFQDCFCLDCFISKVFMLIVLSIRKKNCCIFFPFYSSWHHNCFMIWFDFFQGFHCYCYHWCIWWFPFLFIKFLVKCFGFIYQVWFTFDNFWFRFDNFWRMWCSWCTKTCLPKWRSFFIL
jgi:hypothetical protein